MHSVKKELKKFGYTANQNIVLAVSGGVDSMVMLDYLAHNYNPENIHVAHFNHQLRPESAEEEIMVENYCNKLGVHFHTKKWSNPAQKNIEAEARKARYNFFDQVSKETNSNWLITAHHQGDFAETILMRLIQGAGLKAITGMDPYSEINLSGQEIKLIRPFHLITKDQIYAYAHKNQVPYQEDSSNQENDYLRNRIRNQLMPLLKEENPQVERALVESADLVKASYKLNLKSYNKHFSELIKKTSTKYCLNLKSWRNLSLDEQKIYLTIFIDEDLTQKIPEFNRQLTDQILALINNPTGPNKKLDLGNNYEARLEYEKLVIEKTQPIDKSQSLIIKEKNTWYYLSETEKIGIFSDEIPGTESIPVKTDDKINFTVRHPQAGDRMKLACNEGYITKKINRIFIDQKIPALKREKAWLVEDSAGNIIWLIGYRKGIIESSAATERLCYKKL